MRTLNKLRKTRKRSINSNISSSSSSSTFRMNRKKKRMNKRIWLKKINIKRLRSFKLEMRIGTQNSNSSFNYKANINKFKTNLLKKTEMKMTNK